MGTDDQYNYSIIIPHRNCLDKLFVCLQSIPSRIDIQVIVIDDCSTSCSINDIKNMENRWGEFITLSTKNNSGGGVARNLGIDKAKGKWLLFSDADDCFTNDAFCIFDKYVNCDYDLISFSYSVVTTNDKLYKGSIECKRHKDALIKKYNNSYNRKPLVSSHWTPWDKMFLHSFIRINHIRFEPTMAMNDAYFSVLAGIRASKFKAVLDEVYIYHVYNGSTDRSFDKQKDFSRFEQTIKINNLLMENGCCLYIRSYLNCLLNIFKRYGFISFIEAIKLILYNQQHHILYLLRFLLTVTRISFGRIVCIIRDKQSPNA